MQRPFNKVLACLFLVLSLLVVGRRTAQAAQSQARLVINIPAIIDSPLGLWQLPDTFDLSDSLTSLKNLDALSDGDLTATYGEPLKQAVADQVFFTNLPVGKYLLRQLESSQEGRRLAPILVEIQDSQQEILVEGKSWQPQMPTTTLTLEKVDKATGLFLKGAVFDLLKVEDGRLVPQATGLTTDDQGRVTVANLPLGDYSLREVKAPQGYKQLTQAIPLTLVADATKNVFRVENEKQIGPEMPNTGDASLIWVSLVALGLFALGFWFVKPEREEASEQ